MGLKMGLKTTKPAYSTLAPNEENPRKAEVFRVEPSGVEPPTS